MLDIFRHLPRLIETKKLWLYLYLFKLIMAFLLATPIFLTANSVLSTSSFSKSLLKNWDISIIVEIIIARIETIGPLIVGLLIGLLIYAILKQYLNGGIFYTLVSGKLDRVKAKEFFGECGDLFLMNLKIAGLMLAVYLILIPASMFLVNIIGVFSGEMIGTPAVLLSLFRILILFAVLTGASIFSDSARASAAAFPDLGFADVIKKAADFYRPRLPRLFVIFVITYIPFFVIWFLLHRFSISIVSTVSGVLVVLIEFILFQIVSFARTGQKLWYLIIFGRRYKNVFMGRFLPEQMEFKFDV